MLHSTILKQQQKDKKKIYWGWGLSCGHWERKAIKVSFGLYSQVSLAGERPTEFNAESWDSEDPESNEEILFEAWSHVTANGGQRT